MKRFDSLTHLVDHVMALPDAGTHWTPFEIGNIPDTPRSWDDLVRLATRGWAHGAKCASGMSSRIADRLIQSTSGTVTDSVMTFDVTGASYDVGDYLAGIPECWQSFAPQEGKRAVRIVVDCDASGGIAAETLMKRGIAVTAIVVALQARGYPVTVDVSELSGKTSGKTATRHTHEDFLCRIHDAATGSILDVDRLAFALAHPCMLRALVRSALNGGRGENGVCSWGSDCPIKETQPAHERLGGPYDLFVGGQHLFEVQRWQDGGEAWILAEYERQTKAA